MSKIRFSLPVPARLGDLQRARHGRLKVGLLGGSFNPAHEGHRHIAETALKRLGLDEIWWLVAPQNPLKPVEGMASFNERYASVDRVAQHPHFVISDLERVIGTVYTAHTVAELRRMFPGVRFVWLMGADNLAAVDHWLDWPLLFSSVPVAVLDRPGHAIPALASLAAQRFRRHRVPASRARGLASRPAPAWTFLHCRLSPLSATAIRSAASADPDMVAKLIAIAEHEIDEMKGEDIVTVDLTDKADFADAMVIASGRSGRQVAAIADKLVEKFKAAGARKLGVEGLPAGDWVLIDTGDIVVHLFRPEVRRFYNIEKLWGATMPEPRHLLAAHDPIDED